MNSYGPSTALGKGLKKIRKPWSTLERLQFEAWDDVTIHVSEHVCIRNRLRGKRQENNDIVLLAMYKAFFVNRERLLEN